jgi:hypothetical protein
LFWLVLLFRQGPVPVTTITIITTIIAKALSCSLKGSAVCRAFLCLKDLPADGILKR